MEIRPLAIADAFEITPRQLVDDRGRFLESFRGDLLAEAVGHRSYVLLVIGFFTCGFQLAFITVHLPSYLIDRGLSAEVGGWTLAVIGIFNIIGSLGSGWLSNRMPKRYLLSSIYFIRAIAIVAFIG